MGTIDVKLTAFSHGAGCGCKISPGVLGEILSGTYAVPDNDLLIVGNHSRDDAAVYDLGNGQCLISTTDFFMPIVDDAYDFGRIASANAISDVYAMGGRPLLAIAILGWPIQKIHPSVAKRVIEGARAICSEAGIQLAGGHSIDSPEPIFGLAVNGMVQKENIKRNDTAKVGDRLYLTKKIGVGILSTAEKKGKLRSDDVGLAASQMVVLNSIGTELGRIDAVHALTDVTGFGLLGHMLEMSKGSNVGAIIEYGKIPLLSEHLRHYIGENCIPGGSLRNWDSYGLEVEIDERLNIDEVRTLLCDPQTSGGLLISVSAEESQQIEYMFKAHGLEQHAIPIGSIVDEQPGTVRVV